VTILITGAGELLGCYVAVALREAMPNAMLHGPDLPSMTQSGYR